MNRYKLSFISFCLVSSLYGCSDTQTTLDEAAEETEVLEETEVVESAEDFQLPSSIQMEDIPGGLFVMGGTTREDDAPESSITVSDFKISATEITNQQYIDFLNQALLNDWILVELQETIDPCGAYEEYMVVATEKASSSGEIYLQLGETGGCTSDGHAEHTSNKSWIAYNLDDNAFEIIDEAKSDWPVNWVKWHGANAFAKFYGVSLPTEAQWEYAAKGGLHLEYPTDDGSLDEYKANYNGDTPGVLNEEGHSVAVASYAPNAYGLYDMGGNVWEWCLDYYDPAFYTDATTDPVNEIPADEDEKRVRRGGSWNYHSATLLTYARASDFENRGNNHFGFRIASGS